MLVPGIVVPHHYIGLFPLSHLLHIVLGDFVENGIVQVILVGKVQGNMRVPVSACVSLSRKWSMSPKNRCDMFSEQAFL